MEALSSLVTKSLPSYLKNLPIPNSVSGFAQLSGKEWLQILPFVGTVSLLVYVTVQALCADDRKKNRPAPVNLQIEKSKAKVVHTVDSGKLVEKQVAYCRCWKSKKFPLCDGSHNEHNSTTGDNVGPLLVKKLEYCNPCIEKDTGKVVNAVDIEDLADKEKTSFCRCWRSKKFPYCDGSHNKHNEETGDNVGPLVVKKAAK